MILNVTKCVIIFKTSVITNSLNFQIHEYSLLNCSESNFVLNDYNSFLYNFITIACFSWKTRINHCTVTCLALLTVAVFGPHRQEAEICAPQPHTAAGLGDTPLLVTPHTCGDPSLTCCTRTTHTILTTSTTKIPLRSTPRTFSSPPTTACLTTLTAVTSK